MCIISAFSLQGWCIWEFIKNEDVVEVSFRKYGDGNDSIYPDISICLKSPFYEEKLKNFGIDGLKYSDFLAGRYWDPKLLEIDYEDVSFKLENYIIGNITAMTPSFDNIHIHTFHQFATPFVKCFTINVPANTKIAFVFIVLDNSVFPSGTWKKDDFQLALHYPEQRIRGYQFWLTDFQTRANLSNTSFQIDVNVKDIEILRRRQKHKKHCIDKTAYDNLIIDKIIHKTQCIPPYWYKDSKFKLPNCTEKKQFETSAMRYAKEFVGGGAFQDSNPPCHEIQKIGIYVKEFDVNYSDLNYLDARGK